MAKFKYSITSDNPVEVSHKIGETYSEIIDNCFKHKDIHKSEGALNHVKVFRNGLEVQDWSQKADTFDVTVAIVAKGDDQTLGQIAVIAAVATSSVLTGGLPVWAAVAVNASVAIGASLLVNSLIKPAVPGITGSSDRGLDDSQMYSIQSQSNQLKKYGNVPRTYGQHRVFPNLAANPYTETVTRADGKQVQYYHAIYDFGYGPLLIQDLKIGDTLVSEYNDVEFNIVDPNRPDVAEGEWDNLHAKEFTLYKGDNSLSDISVNLNGNQDEGAPLEDYQVVRNAPPNVNNAESEYSVNLVFPQGLFSVQTDGSNQNVLVKFKVEFAEVGTNDWRTFDDTNFVSEFYDPAKEKEIKFDGASTLALGDSSIRTIPFSEFLYDPIGNFRNLPDDFLSPGGAPVSDFAFVHVQYGWADNGQAQAEIISRDVLNLGDVVSFYGRPVGVVADITPAAPGDPILYKLDGSYRGSIGAYADVVRLDPGPTFVSYERDYLGKPFHSSPDFFENEGQSQVRTNVLAAGEVQVAGNTASPYWITIRFKPFTTNDIKIRVTRISTRVGNAAEIQRSDNMQWNSLNTKYLTDPILTDVRHTFLELRIKATDQINGNIQTLNAIANSYLDVYDPDTQTWSKELTTNPAWVLADLLTGDANKRAIDKSRLDLNSLVAWADYCAEVPDAPPNRDNNTFQRFNCNFVLDYQTTLAGVIEQVCSAAQASLNITDGKYGVLIDSAKQTPVQVFTPKNSSNFQSRRNYSDIPDAIRVKFVDPGSSWETRDQIVYNDGFDEDSAERFDDLDTFACTNFEQAWRHGRYMMAQAKLRQETITISVDFEHLVCTRGDYVVIVQDPMLVGGVAGRVKTVSGQDITIDESFVTEMGKDYGYTYRNANDGIVTDTMTITGANSATLDGSVPNIGDLIAWGEVGFITFDCIVKAIIPNDDYSAQITLVEKNDAIFDAESSQDIPDYNPLISVIDDLDNTAPGPVTDIQVTQNSFDCDGAQYIYFIDLAWIPPVAGNPYETFEIWADNGSDGFLLDGSTSGTSYRYVVNQTYLGDEHSFKVIAVNAAGAKLTLGELTAVSATPVAKTIPPSDVAFASINITNQTLTFDWDEVSDCDVNTYRVRYSKNLDAQWNSSIPLQNVSASTSAITVQARTGSYLVKAVDFAGNESENPAIAITSIPNLFGLNVIEETNDFPTFPGSKIGVAAFGNSLILQEATAGPTYFPSGEYLYQGQLDLGDIFTVRLQALIDAQGYSANDLMANWPTLASVAALNSAGSSDWDVQAYYRSTDQHNIIADWPDLSSIASLSEGVSTIWTPWRKFTAGDFTGQIFQFKLVLESFKPNVTPRVIDAVIRSDMPDRIDNYDNLTSSASAAYSVTYDPEFKGPGTTPNTQITQDDAEQGDYFKITNKTLSGFDIEFFDKNDVRVSRQFDVAVKGFGFKATEVI